MGPLDTQLGLVACILDVLVVLLLGVLGVVAGGLGLGEARRTSQGRGLALVGLLASCAGLLAWLLAGTNLLIVAISRLR
jgi:hypothetical protein